MTKEEMAVLSGEAEYKNRQVYSTFDELKIDKKNGEFVVTLFTQSKDSDGLYPQEKMGTQIEASILKIRHKLVEWGDGEIIRKSNEYNAGAPSILLSTGERGKETELRKLCPALKLDIVLYLLIDGAIVKLTIPRNSLYSDNPDKPLRWYNYVQSFNDDEHTFDYITRLTLDSEVVSDKNGKESVTYYSIGFDRGDKLTEAQFEALGNRMRDLAGDLADYDKKYGDSFYQKKEKKDDPLEKLQNDPNYPTAEKEGINPDDIPF